MPWSAQKECLDRRTVKVTLSAGSALGYDEVVRLRPGDQGFRRFFTEAVRNSGFRGVFLGDAAGDAVDAPEATRVGGCGGRGLGPAATGSAAVFEAFRGLPLPGGPRCSQLGGDATLIVPAPVSPDHSCYTHLGRFLRSAPAGQTGLFWQVVGEAMQRRVSASPLWLSTAGMGVPWLHLRSNSRPKYQPHQPYVVGL